MPRENSRHPSNETRIGASLLRMLESGILDGIECPQCGRQTVSLRFTRPRESEYRTWFICTNCSFRLRAQNIGRPRQFSAARVDEELESYDRAVRRARRLK